MPKKGDRDERGIFCSLCKGEGKIRPVGYMPGLFGQTPVRLNPVPCTGCRGTGYVYEFPEDQRKREAEKIEKERPKKKSIGKPPKREQ